MPTITRPRVETTRVVTGYMYELELGEEHNGAGITRLDIGPFRFPGIPPRVKYPEAVTNEMCPPGWASIHWVTDPDGTSWLRWEGPAIYPEDGENIFQFVSNYPPTTSGPSLYVWRGNARTPEKYMASLPDYSNEPPAINPRHDVIGKGTTFATGPGCAPVIAFAAAVGLAVRHFIG